MAPAMTIPMVLSVQNMSASRDESLVAAGIAEILEMTPENRINFLAAAIQAETEGSENWLALIEIFTVELKAFVETGELVAAEPATWARN